MVSITLDSTFFIQMGLFLVLMYLLNILLYRPVLAAMEERSRKISGMESEAASIENDLEEKLVNYKKRLAAAKESGSQNRAVLKKEGLDKEVSILSSAHSEANETLGQARERISKERDAAISGLKALTDELAKDIAEKALGRSL